MVQPLKSFPLLLGKKHPGTNICSQPKRLVSDLLQQFEGHGLQVGVGSKFVLTSTRQAHRRVGAAILAVEDHCIVPGQLDQDSSAT